MSRRSITLLLVAALPCAAACGGGGESGDAAPRRHVVEIRQFQFVPQLVAAAPGDTVVWVNHDAVPHTATSAGEGWDSGSIPAGGSWSQVVESDSTTYVCTFHPNMTGRIEPR